MADANDSDPETRAADILRFPQSRVRPPASSRPVRELGTSAFAARFGYLHEVTCPVCGNRHG